LVSFQSSALIQKREKIFSLLTQSFSAESDPRQ
jgi:hypothetical protein